MPLIYQNKISDSINIEQYGDDNQGMVVVTVDDNQRFETYYSAEMPCPSFEILALSAISNC